MMSCSPFSLIEKCLSCSPLSFLFIVLESRNNTILLFKLFTMAYCHYVNFVKNTQKQLFYQLFISSPSFKLHRVTGRGAIV